MDSYAVRNRMRDYSAMATDIFQLNSVSATPSLVPLDTTMGFLIVLRWRNISGGVMLGYRNSGIAALWLYNRISYENSFIFTLDMQFLVHINLKFIYTAMSVSHIIRAEE